MGTADVIPGVSGGTMAFILGIYPELVAAIKSFDLLWMKSLLRFDLGTSLSRPKFGFLIPLMIGIGGALLFFTRIIPLPVLLHTHPEEIYGLFFGLIAGSILVLIREMKGIGLNALLQLVIGFSLGLLVFNLVPLDTSESAWFIFLTGSLAICAMILPGISGSFILLILNKYTYIFSAIGDFRFSILAPFALGAVTGLVLFSRILSYLLHRYYRATILVIIGVLIASLQIIWPFQERTYIIARGKPRLIDSIPVFPAELSQTVLFSILMVVIGFITILVINRVAIIKGEVAE
ncbi:MAG: DUF368 domain-containing protein [Gammaproteobacteria bacterium]